MKRLLNPVFLAVGLLAFMGCSQQAGDSKTETALDSGDPHAEWKTVSAGYSHHCAISGQGEAACWGFASFAKRTEAAAASEKPPQDATALAPCSDGPTLFELLELEAAAALAHAERRRRVLRPRLRWLPRRRRLLAPGAGRRGPSGVSACGRRVYLFASGHRGRRQHPLPRHQ